MQTWMKTTAMALGLALVAAPAAAQAPGIDLRLNPRIGIYEPLTNLSEVEEAGSTFIAEQSGSLALGLGLELDMIMLPVNVRLNLDYATGSEVTTSMDGVEFGEPIETNLLAVVGDVVFRPLPRIIILQPYLFAGGGLKQYDVGEEATPGSFRSESDPTLHFGGGVDFGLGPLAFNAEVGDYLSWYSLDLDGGESDTETQHDLFVTIGFSIGIL